MKIEFENNDVIFLDGNEFIYEFPKFKSVEYDYRIRLINHDNNFFLSPIDYIKVFDIRDGFLLNSPALGKLVFIGIDNHLIMCQKDDEIFYFNGDGQMCWWDIKNKVWHYDDESECMIYPHNTDWRVNNWLRLCY